MSLDSFTFNNEDWLYSPVVTTGDYDTQHQILLDNQVHNTKAGYSIFTPLILSQNTAILVNRGWTAIKGSRESLPNLTLLDTNSIRVNGVLSPLPAKGLVLSDNANSYNQWPTVLQYLDTDEIDKHLGYRLLPAVLTITDSAKTEYQILPLKVNMRSAKHTAYAFQWFALSFALITIYIIVNIKRTN